jgi:hypothetical protein
MSKSGRQSYRLIWPLPAAPWRNLICENNLKMNTEETAMTLTPDQMETRVARFNKLQS